MTKILIVSSDYDYGVCTFERSGISKESVYQKCIKNGGEYTEIIEENEIDFKSMEFPEVPKEFIDFLESEKDYDDSKHKNWFVIH